MNHQPRDWKVVRPDGTMTGWMTKTSAQRVWRHDGGTLVWRYDRRRADRRWRRWVKRLLHWLAEA